MRTDAYIDFIKSVANLTIAQRNTDAAAAAAAAEEAEAITALIDAKARIAVYGSAEVAKALAAFFREFGKLDSSAALAAFVGLVSLMRAETPSGRDRRALSSRDIGQILFGTDTD